MTKSVTAKRLGIDNTPNEQQIEYLRELCANVLQPLRDALGPIVIPADYEYPTK